MRFRRRLLLLALASLLAFTFIQFETAKAKAAEDQLLARPVQGYHAYDEEVLPYVDWGVFWQTFRQHVKWNLEWYDETSLEWVSLKQDLEIIREYPEPHKCKLTLIFSASQSGNYRLTLGIEKNVTKYVHKENSWNYTLLYKEWAVVFDWSDIKMVPNLIVTHGTKLVGSETWYWFRIRKDNISKGAHIEIDPMFEYYNTGDDAYQYLYGVKWEGQTFTTSHSYNITSVKLKMYRFGNPGTMTVGIRATSDGKPTGSDLTNGTANADTFTDEAPGAWYQINFTTGVVLSKDVMYGIVVRATSGDMFNSVFWREDCSSPTYSDGTRVDSSNSGSTWVVYAGNDFMFETWGVYVYNFYGVYDEDTGQLKQENERAVNVTAYYADGTASETFEVNGSYLYTSESVPLYFHFDLGADDREYWLSQGQDSLDIYVFDTTLTGYYISFLDLAGTLETYAWVSASRYINGSLMVVEKRKVDVEKAFTMSLKNGQKYTIKVEAEAGTPYTFGDLLMTDDTTPQLTIKGLEFPDNIILAYKYLRIYADRQLGAGGVGNITVTYQDLKEATVKVTITIKFDNGSVAYGPANETTNSFVHIWQSAYNNTNYRVIAEINHGQFGVLTEKWYLPRSWSEAPWGLEILGSLPFETALLIPLAIIMMMALIFSSLTVPIACFLVTAVATILNYMGWIPGGIDGRALVAAWAFSILTALLWAGKKIKT